MRPGPLAGAMAPRASGTARAAGHGLPALRRRGTVTELLFLFECTTRPTTQLRPIAEKLGLTVQAASYSFRQLARRGLAEVREGRYRATVAGVAWLQGALGVLRDDVDSRLNHLDVVRSCRAIALADLSAGQSVSLELRDGLLSARPGSGSGSHGRTVTAVRKGGLVEVDRLEGIVPIARGRITVLALPVSRLGDPRLRSALDREVRRQSPSLLAAYGLEAFHSLSPGPDRPVLRFAVASACQEASRLGVDSTIVVLEPDLPRLLEQFPTSDAAPLEVRSVRASSRADARRAR